MMTGYELLWFFFFYAFAGWVIGTVGTAAREKKFADAGFLYGPWCPAYGFGGVAFALFLTELKDHLFFLFVGGMILSFLTTYLTGFVLERIFHRKWWDFSRKRFQFGGYVSLPWSVVWGILGVLCIRFANPFLTDLLKLLPITVGKLILLVLGIVFALDFVGTLVGILKVKSSVKKASLLHNVAENLQKTADQMGEGLTAFVLRRMERAYPRLAAEELLRARREQEKAAEEARSRSGVFAVGCCFYKLACLFFLGAFLGDITETIFCYVTAGKLMSRSSVVYGPFSIVWGLGCVLLTAILYRYKDRSDSYIFCFGTVLGGAYERDGERHAVTLEPKLSESGTYLLGFRGSGVRTKGNIFQTVWYSAYEVKYWISTTLQSLGMMFRGRVSADDISGPVGIVNTIGNTYEASKQDGGFYVWLNMLNISILLSANLGVMNLLPIPALDGGRLVFLFLEVIRRGKRIDPEKEGMVHFVGLMLLMALMLVVMFNDFRNIL